MTKLKVVKSPKTWKDWTAEDVLKRLSIEPSEEQAKYALAYITDMLDRLKSQAEDWARVRGNSPENFIIGSIMNAYEDGEMFPETASEYDEPEGSPEDQEIIEVSQTEVKKALKALLSNKSGILATLYLKHDEYNQEFFYGRLSVPLITIDKLSSKTLGSYTEGTDNTGLENHIRFNQNFIALNTETRILETLRHEMVHQYQDEVLYEKKDKDGNVIRSGAKRPREWHNKDFKEWAEKVGIPCIGRHGGGNPAKMPEAKSYNRKFRCGCMATNGYPLTIWSTRPVHAVCQVCGKPFAEVKKAGTAIKVTASDIEQKDKDSIELRLREDYENFERFVTKEELTAKVSELKEQKANYKEGIYQKGHNAYYSWGYQYWVAWTIPVVNKPKSKTKPVKKGAETHDKGYVTGQTK
jgi:predicted SprT family Zn-dependent metalloprotease